MLPERFARRDRVQAVVVRRATRRVTDFLLEPTFQRILMERLEARRLLSVDPALFPDETFSADDGQQSACCVDFGILPDGTQSSEPASGDDAGFSDDDAIFFTTGFVDDGNPDEGAGSGDANGVGEDPELIWVDYTPLTEIELADFEDLGNVLVQVDSNGNVTATADGVALQVTVNSEMSEILVAGRPTGLVAYQTEETGWALDWMVWTFKDPDGFELPDGDWRDDADLAGGDDPGEVPGGTGEDTDPSELGDDAQNDDVVLVTTGSLPGRGPVGGMINARGGSSADLFMGFARGGASNGFDRAPVFTAWSSVSGSLFATKQDALDKDSAEVEL
jgi:hypothetical protein